MPTETIRIAARTGWRVAGLLAVLVLLASCTSLTGKAPLPPSAERAQQAQQRGDHAAAAREFEALAADNSGSVAQDYLLRATAAWLKAGRGEDARRTLGLIEGPLDAARATERALLDVELSALSGQAQQAWIALNALPPPSTPAALVARYQDLRQQLAFATSRPLEGVRAQIARERVTASDSERRSSRRELLSQLRTAVQRGVKIEPALAGTDPVLRGWLELASIVAQDESGTSAAAMAWRTRFPDHPARDLLRGDAGTVATALPAGAHVAVLLPVTGRTASAAAQIREGLVAGYFATASEGRPSLRIYDTAAAPVAEALTAATRAGAVFVIGPLTREDVVAAADFTDRRPPLLALNFLPTERAAGPPSGFYQFALSPEDEARQVARRAFADGRRRAVALVPAGDWGTRVLNAFREEFEAAGGQLLGSSTITPNAPDYSRPIQAALRLSDSEARRRRLEGIIGAPLSFQPRRRADIDFLFTPAPAATARALRPQLRFFRAGDLAAYGTSDVFEPGMASNTDLDGLMFPETPWLLGGTPLVDSLRASQREALGADAAPRGRLFAFGFDAWRLATALRAAPAARDGAAGITLEGATGTLTVDAERRVRRELVWAQIRGGSAKALGGASPPAASAQSPGEPARTVRATR